MTVSKTASSCAALSLVAAIGLALPPDPAAAVAVAVAAEDPQISEIGYTLDTDFIEIAAAPGPMSQGGPSAPSPVAAASMRPRIR
ncbi:hypothetical protein [Brevibacterium aurantiacum]|uniref:hypothetical protein n=1 Tax=Brevibacterium aurantiacum TaxID=273384 RepID=UPI003F8DE2F9